MSVTPFDTGPGGVFRYCPKCAAAAMRVVSDQAASVRGLRVRAVHEPRGGGGRRDRGRARADGRARAGQGARQGALGPARRIRRPGETAEEALAREIREEVGLEVTAMRYLGSWPNVYEYGGVRYRTLDFGFACGADGVEQVAAGGERGRAGPAPGAQRAWISDDSPSGPSGGSPGSTSRKCRVARDPWPGIRGLPGFRRRGLAIHAVLDGRASPLPGPGTLESRKYRARTYRKVINRGRPPCRVTLDPPPSVAAGFSSRPKIPSCTGGFALL